MRVLVTGHRGMLARDLVPCLQQAGFAAIGCGRAEFDITQEASVCCGLEAVRPDVLINTAAYTAVDRAEAEPEVAFAVNRDGPSLLAAACREAGIPLIHISTDYVFNGSSRYPYREEEPATPLGIYGQSKWAGEERIRAVQGRYLIVRTAWLYGLYGNNFVKTMLRLAREREVLRVVDDQHGCPTWTKDLAGALAAICRRLECKRDPSLWGTYHFCGTGQTTWRGFAQAIVDAGKTCEPLLVQRVEPIPTVDYPTAAQRPANSVLDCSKIEAVFGLTPRPWRESLCDFMRELYA
jgi:dTDP-4-dehydrorhamnose reductase